MATPNNIDLLERATEFVTAARNTTDEDARVLFAARARNALAEAEAKLASLRINVETVERILSPPSEPPKKMVGAERDMPSAGKS